MHSNIVLYKGKTHQQARTANTQHVGASLTMLLVALLFSFCIDIACAEHAAEPVTFTFTGETGDLNNDMQNFTLPYDGALYFKLMSYTPSGATTYTPTIGFMHIGQAPCPARYDWFIDNPVIGTLYGPYYVEAEDYVSYFYLPGGADAYELKIEYRRQLLPNDAEPNDSVGDAQNLGVLTTSNRIDGHIGYLGCIHDRKDYIRFEVSQSGEYLFDLKFDSPFREKSECRLYFHLQDETSGTWLLSYTGSEDAFSLGPKNLDASHTFLMSMESSTGCFDTIYEGGGSFIVNNKAGAYTVLLRPQQPMPSEPFAITDLTVNSSTLWPGENMNGKVFIQSYSPDSQQIELILQLQRLSDGFQVSAKHYPVSLSPNALQIHEFSLRELIAPQEIISLQGGRYKIVATAQKRDPSGQVIASSSMDIAFEINEHDKNVSSIISLFLKKKKPK